MRKRSHGVGKRLTSVLLLGASLILVTVGYAGFGVIESGSNNDADLVFVSVDDEGSSNITLGKLGITVSGVTSQFTFNTLTETEYTYDYFSDSDHGEETYDMSTETEGETTSTSTTVNGKIKIGLTVNLDSSYDSGATDDVPNIANLDYDNAHYKNLKVTFYFGNTYVQNVTATIYPTNYSSRYYEMTIANTVTASTTTMEYTFPLKSSTSTSLYDLATFDSSYPKYSGGVISDYKVPITVEFDCTAIDLPTYYGPNSTTTFTATFSIEGDA